jgi:hypothetical protein
VNAVSENQKDSSQSVLVDRSHPYTPIDANTPRGVKCILINKKAGVAVIGDLNKSNENFFDHFAPLPTFR